MYLILIRLLEKEEKRYNWDVKKSATYKFISAFLSLSIFLGVSIPSGLHAMSKEVCNEEDAAHQAMPVHEDDCPMEASDLHSMPKHHEAHDFGFACACSVDEAPLNTEAQAQLKVKAPVISVIQILAEDHTDETENHAFQHPVSDFYSPPPIYLINESFLN